MRLFSNALKYACIMAAFAISAHAADVTLQWEAPASLANLDGYRVYYGQTSRGLSTNPSDFPYDSNADAGLLLTYEVTGLADVDALWCFTVLSYSNRPEVNDSDYANEVCITLTKLGPPKNAKVIIIEFTR